MMDAMAYVKWKKIGHALGVLQLLQTLAQRYEVMEYYIALTPLSETTITQMMTMAVTLVVILKQVGSEQSLAEQDPVYEQRYAEMALSLALNNETTLAQQQMMGAMPTDR